MQHLFRLLSGLLRDWPLATTPAPAPIPPSSSPLPPAPDVPPVAFVLQAVPQLDVTISTLISPAKTVATIATAATGVSVLASPSVPGCSFSLQGSPPTAALLNGTPSTVGDYRVQLTYVSADGVVLGGTVHNVTVVDPALIVSVGPQANLDLVNGRHREATLVNLSLSRLLEGVSVTTNIAITGRPLQTPPGTVQNLLVFEWTPAATSTGRMYLAGAVNMEPGSYTLTASYWAPRNSQAPRLIGQSSHTIRVFDEPVSAPAPAPTPAPPAPAPAPAPTPPAEPVVSTASPDGFLGSVVLLARLNRIPETDGSAPATITATSAIGPSLSGQVTGSRDGALFNGGGMLAQLDSSVFIGPTCTVDCIGAIDFEATGLWPGPRDLRVLSPLLTWQVDGQMHLCLAIYAMPSISTVARPVFLTLLRRRGDNQVVNAISDRLTQSGAFTHYAGSCSETQVSAYADGSGRDAGTGSLWLTARNGGTLHVGGSGGLGPTFDWGDGLCSVKPLQNSVLKELRVTSAQRYPMGGSLSLAQRSYPWPTY